MTQCAENQLYNKQDFSCSYRQLVDTRGKKFDGLFIADGHGDDTIIDEIKEYYATNKLEQFIRSEDPMFMLNYNLKKIYGDINSGSTAIFVKIFDNVIQIWSVGDSRVAICINNEMKYINCPHNTLNPLEMQRLNGKIKINSIKNVAIIKSKTSVINKPEIYIQFNTLVLSMTQSLGHYGLTGYAPEKYEYMYNSSDKVDVIAGSDGFWDQIILSGEDSHDDLLDLCTMSAIQLVNKAETRWKQPWDCIWSSSEFSFIKKGLKYETYDDICVGLWSNHKPEEEEEEDEEEEVAEEETELVADVAAAELADVAAAELADVAAAEELVDALIKIVINTVNSYNSNNIMNR